jgi:hypothetical protein
MSDTVSSAVIVSSLGSDGPTFLFVSDALEVAGQGAVHVPGGVYTEPMSLGLAVDFRTLTPDLQAITPRADSFEQPASVSGYAALVPDEHPPGIPGALHHI